MATRAELRSSIRSLLELDEEELPDALLDVWLQDGYDRAISIEDRWPFFEETWSFTTTAQTVDYAKTAIEALHPSSYAIDSIASLLDTTAAVVKLIPVDHDAAEAEYGLGTDSGGVPAYWSEWGNSVHLWPAPTAVNSVRVRGWRRSNWASGDDVEVDADSRLHLPIMYFGLAMAYGQQEDEILKAEWMSQFEDGVRRAHTAIMSPPGHRPLILSGAPF